MQDKGGEGRGGTTAGAVGAEEEPQHFELFCVLC